MIQLNKILKSFTKAIDQFEQLAAINNVEVSRNTKDRGALIHDDCQDALAGAVRPEWSRWVGILRIAAQSHKERLLDDELQKFARSVLGYDATGSTWFSI